MQDIWRSRRYLQEIEGFDHSVVNATLGACGDSPDPQGIPWLPFFIWQSGENKVINLYLKWKVHNIWKDSGYIIN